MNKYKNNMNKYKSLVIKGVCYGCW